jgi:hypothetical protein
MRGRRGEASSPENIPLSYLEEDGDDCREDRWEETGELLKPGNLTIGDLIPLSKPAIESGEW